MTQGTTSPLTLRSQALAGNLLGIGSMIVWAAGFPAAEALLETWDPLALVTGRFAIGLLTLLPIWLWLDGGAALRQAKWLRGMGIGGIAFGGGAWLILISQWLTDPVTVAIIAASSPIAATLVQWVYERHKLRMSFVLGMIASVIGGIIATGGAAPGNLGLGALAAVGSCILFAWGSYATVRDLPDLSLMGRTSVTIAGGLVFVGGAFIIARTMGIATGPAQVFDPVTLALLAVYGIGGLALSQFLWIASVERLGVAVAAFHINAAPFYVMLILLILGGAWSWPQAIGAAIVGMGVILAQR
ncbi:MAG: DMT family transporter [Rhodobacterales bacterium]|nr:DMT family transporter [Rhodobacterales bacterium]